MKRAEKSVLIDEIASDFERSETFFVADYRGLDMPAITDLRDRLGRSEANVRIVKNTLARLAAKRAGYDDMETLFKGPTAITFVSGEPAAVAKVLGQVARETNLLEVRGGIMDGRVVDSAQIRDIASLPPRETILAMLLSAVNGPLTMTVGVLNAPLRDIVGIIDAYIEKRQAEEAA